MRNHRGLEAEAVFGWVPVEVERLEQAEVADNSSVVFIEVRILSPLVESLFPRILLEQFLDVLTVEVL